MLKKTIFVLLVAFTIKLDIANAVTTEYIPVFSHKIDFKADKSIKTIIDTYSKKYSVESKLLADVIDCESSYNIYALGDGGHSRGLAQIHDEFHPEVSDEQAYDPEFAVEFLARYISEGKGSQWTCYRKTVDNSINNK
jgi:soluble lytic murein transglycosylase-like protein